MSIQTVWVSFFNFFAALKKFPTNCGILSNDLFCEIKKEYHDYVCSGSVVIRRKNIKLYTNTYREFAWIWNTEFCVYQINICGYYLSIIFIDFFFLFAARFCRRDFANRRHHFRFMALNEIFLASGNDNVCIIIVSLSDSFFSSLFIILCDKE